MTDDATDDDSTVKAAATTPSFDDFKGAMSESTQELLTKANITDFKGFGKDYESLTGMIGRKGLIKPEEGASDDLVAEYTKGLFKEIGVPESGSYEFKIPDTWNKESGITQGLVDNLAKVGVSKGISNDAYQAIVDTLGDTVGKMQEQSAEMFGTEASLKKEWGDKYEANTKRAEAFIDKVSPDSKSLMSLASFKKFALDMATKSAEDTMQGGDATDSSKSALQDELALLNKEWSEASKERRYNDVERIGKRRRAIFERLA